ncbi:IS21 family transposase [Cetobacterium sp. ZWU0022]|uniref:IS21 family transposase n=1 Tax=Cetobacterium sp. ZWU0022 TaxID=1340502 RepID=UPI000690C0DB|nr:IS21 family transposase [Cetobacterium sp. ZWU0022]
MKGLYMFEEIKKLKESQVAKQLNIDTRTVKRYWNMSEQDFLNLVKKLNENKSKSILDQYKDEILGFLITYKDFTAAQIYDRLKEQHINFDLCKSSVRNYVAKLREKNNLNKKLKEREYVAVEELPMGKQAQVDFGEIILYDVENNPVKVWTFAMMLSHSRYKYGCWQDKPFNVQDFVEAHNKAFQYFGGIPEEIVYDRTKVALVNENEDGTFKLCKAFEEYVEKVKFNPVFCKPYDPESKGKIEAVVKYFKFNFANHRTFKGIDNLNAAFHRWLEGTGNTKVHQTTKKVPSEVFSLERQYLSDKHLSKDIPIIQHRVKKDNTISYEGNRYSLPKGTYSAHKDIVLNIVGDLLEIKTLDLNLIISYKMATGKGKLIQKEPYHRQIDKEVSELKTEVFEQFKYNERILEYIEKLVISDPKNVRRNLVKLQKLGNEFSLNALVGGVEYSLLKGDLSLGTLSLKVKQNSFSVKKEEILQSDLIPKICDVNTRSISEYQNIQEEGL